MISGDTSVVASRSPPSSPPSAPYLGGVNSNTAPCPGGHRRSLLAVAVGKGLIEVRDALSGETRAVVDARHFGPEKIESIRAQLAEGGEEGVC